MSFLSIPIYLMLIGFSHHTTGTYESGKYFNSIHPMAVLELKLWDNNGVVFGKMKNSFDEISNVSGFTFSQPLYENGSTKIALSQAIGVADHYEDSEIQHNGLAPFAWAGFDISKGKTVMSISAAPYFQGKRIGQVFLLSLKILLN